MYNENCVAQEVKIDKDRYREILLEASETLLGYFGFDKMLFGVATRSKNRKW